MATVETPTTIVESITIDAPAVKVFAALTDPDQLVQWWGSADLYRTTEMRADLRPGGAWSVDGIGRDGPFTVGGVYTRVEPPRLLEFTWAHNWGAPDARLETLVRYELTESGGATQLTVTHSGFADADDAANHAKGWKRVLNWLSAYLTR
jgi:uncharacterized protein YndB with AHSA1/START domain